MQAGEGGGWELQTPSSDLLSAPVSFESWLVFIKPFRSAAQGRSLTNYQPPMVSLLDLLYIVGLLMASIPPIRRPFARHQLNNLEHCKISDVVID